MGLPSDSSSSPRRPAGLEWSRTCWILWQRHSTTCSIRKLYGDSQRPQYRLCEFILSSQPALVRSFQGGASARPPPGAPRPGARPPARALQAQRLDHSLTTGSLPGCGLTAWRSVVRERLVTIRAWRHASPAVGSMASDRTRSNAAAAATIHALTRTAPTSTPPPRWAPPCRTTR